MKEAIRKIFQESKAIQERTLKDNIDAIQEAVEAVITVFKSGGKVILFGNGGSAADSQHIAAELIGRFRKERRAFPAVALTTDTSIITALSNDYSFDIIFARQLEGLGRHGDLAIGISTSGNSKNVLEAIKLAKKMGIKTLALSGGTGGELALAADIKITVPSKMTARVQEAHICIAHCICELVEERIGGAS